MRKLLLSAMLFPVLAWAQSQNQNYILTKTYKVESDSTIAMPSVDQAAMEVNYFDGLGRPIQKVQYKQGANGNSIITPFIYDGFGRQDLEYLPYVESFSLNYISGATDKASTYYSTGDPTETGNPHFDMTGNAYSQKLFENSPLNRVLKQAAPGDDWATGNGHEVQFDYQVNGASEVRKFNVASNWSTTARIYNTTFSPDGFYPAGELYKTITRDENWNLGMGADNHTTQEFKDKEGRLLLKRTFDFDVPHDTYYVYDIYGNLSYVIPPLVDTSSTITAQLLNGLCYQYKYDHRNRLAEKKLPGKAWEYILYDSLDRPVVTGPVQSPFGSSETGWLYTKYDVFGRVCYTGWFKQTTLQGDGDISAEVQSMRLFYSDPAHVFNAVRSITNLEEIANVTAGYRVGHVPTGLELLTINYYDNYTFPESPSGLPTTVLGKDILSNAKGLQTGTWSRILYADTGVEKAEKGYTLYDKKSRPALSHTTELQYGYNQVQTRYAFDGTVLLTKTLHKFDGSSPVVTVIDSMDYSPQGRLIGHFNKINSKPWELLAHHSYDNLGQLLSKNVGGQDLSTFTGLQKVDYRYNVRGWLTGINDIRDLDNDTEDDLFAFGINYNQPTSEDYPATPLYNGNISETYWLSRSDNVLRAYGYDYDHLNRLLAATYQKPGTTTALGNYDEYIGYDKNGNIQSLARTGDLDDPGMNIMIDYLTYAYDPASPNQLRKVTDDTNDPKGFLDDSDGTNDTADDYQYDSFGNMTFDDNKKISSITYNHLNLPVRIIIGNDKIDYLYDASGRKLLKTVTDSATVTHTSYQSGFQYKNNVLQFFPTQEGYVSYTSGSGIDQNLAYNYVYNYTDHLGNIRLSWSKDPSSNVLKILEENHYYPFGLKHTNYSSDIKKYLKEGMQPLGIKPVPVGGSVEYKYKYQGQERQDELGLNWDSFKWRNYDYAIGRFMSIDPLAEKYSYQSPYNFAENKVIECRELEGLEGISTTRAQWNGAFKEMIQTFAGTFDKIATKFSIGVSASKDVAPATSIETSTTASAKPNFLSFLNSAEFNNGVPTTNAFTTNIESKTEVKVSTEVKANVEGISVKVEGGVSRDLATKQTSVETKATAGVGPAGVYVANSTNVKSKESKTSGGLQVEASTPKVNSSSYKVTAKIYVGQE